MAEAALIATCPQCNRPNARMPGDTDQDRARFLCECGRQWEEDILDLLVKSPPPPTPALVEMVEEDDLEADSSDSVPDSSDEDEIDGSPSASSSEVFVFTPSVAPSPSSKRKRNIDEEVVDSGSMDVAAAAAVAPPSPRPGSPRRRLSSSKRPPVTDVTKYCGFCCVLDTAANLLQCYVCGNSGHSTCLGHSDELWSRCKASQQWLCIECKFCFICCTKGDENKTLLCDVCDNGVHMDCLDPPLTEEPEGDYVCPQCSGDPKFSIGGKHSKKYSAKISQMREHFLREGPVIDEGAAALVTHRDELTSPPRPSKRLREDNGVKASVVTEGLREGNNVTLHAASVAGVAPDGMSPIEGPVAAATSVEPPPVVVRPPPTTSVPPAAAHEAANSQPASPVASSEAPPSPAKVIAEFRVKKQAVLLARYQARTKQSSSEAAGALAEYCRFMTLKIGGTEADCERYVAPPRIRTIWKLHNKVDDFAHDCKTAGATYPISFQDLVATDSPCGATGAKILTVYAYFERYGHWPPFREWRYYDAAVDTILSALPAPAASVGFATNT